VKVGLVVPHIFMHREILPEVIFSPANLAIDLANGLRGTGAEVVLFTPGPVDSQTQNITADLSLFETELEGRGYGYTELLKKHPFTFVTLARQVQAELVAKAYEAANNGDLDVVHIYTNEEEIGMAFAGLCKKPVVFTHHDPFNFLIKYKNNMPKYAHLNWISISQSQRRSMPEATNWLGNVYHGLDGENYQPISKPNNDYVAFMGRIIEPKGLHLAINAVKKYNSANGEKLKLKIAGKHYAGHNKDRYWREVIEPEIDDEMVVFEGFIGDESKKTEFLANAKCLVVPSIFDEPFGMVSIEALACGTPVVGLDSGALPEVIVDGKTGYVVGKQFDSEGKLDNDKTASSISEALSKINQISRADCRQDFEQRFTTERMVEDYFALYKKALSTH
jgi:glycosyltransferase involved in cell wall biosynthesis